MDVSDNTIVLDKNGVEHINRRHGKQGKADKSMANSEDVGRIKYVLEHFDGATLEPTFAKGYSREPLNKSPSFSAERENRRLPLGSSDSVGK